MSIKHFFEVYYPKRMWRKLWLGLAGFPMLPQHRAKLLKMGGVNIRGRVLIYGGVGVDTVAPDKIFIGNNVAITAGTKILTHYLDPSVKGRMFRIGEVHIEDDVFIYWCERLYMQFGKDREGGNSRCRKCSNKRYSALSSMGWESCKVH